MNRGSRQSFFVALNGKHSNQQTVVTALSAIHKALTQLKNYPAGVGWEILSIETSATPNFIEQESSGQWLYGSILQVSFYMKGV
jgi:hypothetical protein